ncbi:MAG: glutamate--tRNA ligase [Gemmatimonadota bacterium]|nr:glutamate--tRNA ligase [Gemmatimonadota bacterium]
MTNPAIRVRFAPSPTGYLHVGGARTALFNWLYARQQGGKFLLRVEDTDKARSSDEHTQVILDGLTWLGLDWDEEPVFQGARLKRHQEWAEKLKDTGHLYEDDGAMRFKMPDETIKWTDLVHGDTSFEGRDIKDWVLLRSDGTPTYNFSVVADDIDMELTHVIRGDDHLSNTPKQIAVYKALGQKIPKFGHVPMIHGTDGKKLSKRHGATAVGDYASLGILPGALRNFLALLGWNPKSEQELFFEIDDLIKAFALKDVQKKAAIFDPTKLEWMNGQYISRTPVEELLPLIKNEMSEKYGIDIDENKDQVDRTVQVTRERARTTLNLAWQTALRMDASLIERTDKANKLISKDPEGFSAALNEAGRRLGGLADSDWTEEKLDAELRELAESMEIGVGKVMQPIRVALTGDTVSEAVNVLLVVVGKDESLKRISSAKDWN